MGDDSPSCKAGSVVSPLVNEIEMNGNGRLWHKIVYDVRVLAIVMKAVSLDKAHQNESFSAPSRPRSGAV